MPQHMVVNSILSPLNEKILGFLKSLSSTPEYMSKTHMNLANLSRVFSPGLVRKREERCITHVARHEIRVEFRRSCDSTRDQR